MPVSYSDRNGKELYLIPAPLVSINKQYDTTGDGNVIGAKYSITLNGKLTADRGSPTWEGLWYDTAVDVPYTPPVDGEAWYRSIQKKQQALSNLFSRENEGGKLHLLPPEDLSVEGLQCFPRILSVEFPEQGGGAPNVCDYTIQLECDRIVGYGVKDKDGHQAANKDFLYLVQSADEAWSLEEQEQTQLEILGTGATTDYLVNHGTYKYLNKSKKVYLLTHTITATGKRRYDESDTKAGKLLGDNPLAPDPTTGLMTTDSVQDGEAWQQARGYVLTKISNTGLGTRTGGYQTEDGISSGTPPSLTNKHGFISIDGINLPSSYKGYDYKRIQQVDKTGGSFSITESWLMVDGTLALAEGVRASLSVENPVIETMEVATSQTESDGLVKVDITGTIEALASADTWAVDVTSDHGSAAATATNKQQHHKDHPEQVTRNQYKWEQAEIRLAYILPYLYQVAHKATNRGGTDPTTGNLASEKSPVVTNTSLNPIPISKSITRNQPKGTINYSISYNNRPSTCIPGALKETISVEDHHPHHVFSSTAVIGRRRGPVFQDINTQTAWRRSLTVEVQVSGILHGCNWTTAMMGKPSNVTSINDNNDYNQQKALRTIIDTMSPAGKKGVDNIFVGPSDPTETWDPIAGRYTYRIEWTYDLFEGEKDTNPRTGALGFSYLGNKKFQYPRVVTNEDFGDRPDHVDPPGQPW